MKNKKMKLLAFIMMLAMLASTLLIPANALLLLSKDADSKANYPLTLNQIGGTTDNLSTSHAYTRYSSWAASAITITSSEKEAAFSSNPAKANNWTLGNVDGDQSKSANGANFSLWYANDNTYLYFYLETTLPTTLTKLNQNTTTDIVRLYVDFYNQHTKVFNNTTSSAAANSYMHTYFGTGNGGRFHYAVSSGAGTGTLGADAFIGTAGTDYKFFYKYNGETTLSSAAYDTTKDIDGYVLKGRIKLPGYVSKAINEGEQPIIGIGQEIRSKDKATSTPETDYNMRFGDISYKSGWIIGTPSSVWGDYTLCPDVILANNDTSSSIADARGKTIALDGEMSAEEGWSTVPFSVLSHYNVGEALDSRTDFPELYMSADSENLYFFVDAKDTIARTWFNLQLDPNIGRDTTSGAEDKWLSFIFNGTYHGSAADQDPNNDRMSISYFNVNVDGTDDTKKRYTDNYTGSDYVFGGTKMGYSEDLSRIEVKIPMSDYMKELILNGSSFNVDCLVSFKEGGTGNQIRLEDSLYKTYSWSNGTIPVYVPAYYLIDRTVANTNVNVNVDGVKDASEGWATVPFDSLGKSFQKAGYKLANPEVYLSTDGENLYAFYDAKDSKIFVAYLILQFDTNVLKGSKGYDKVLSMRLNGTATGWQEQFAWGSNTGNDLYTQGKADDYKNDNIAHPFDNAEYTCNADKTTMEIKVPLPEWVKEELYKGDFTFKAAFDVRIDVNSSTDYETDRVSSEYGMAWNNGTVPVTLPKYKVNANIAIEGLQEKVIMDGNVVKATDVRFVSSLFDSYENYAELGYEFTYNGKTAVRNCNFVYEKLSSGDGFIEAGVGDFEDTQYFFCFTITGLTAGDYTFDVRAFTKANGEAQANYSYKTTVSFTVNADGTVTVK